MSYKNNPVKKMSAGLSDLMGMEAWEGRGRKEGGGGGIRQGRKLDVSHDERRGRKGRMEGGREGDAAGDGVGGVLRDGDRERGREGGREGRTCAWRAMPLVMKLAARRALMAPTKATLPAGERGREGRRGREEGGEREKVEGTTKVGVPQKGKKEGAREGGGGRTYLLLLLLRLLLRLLLLVPTSR
jgi:hypothetical protein